MIMDKKLIVEAHIGASVDKVWKSYNDPKQIVKWNSAGDGWGTVSAKNDLKVGGKFVYRMEPRDNPDLGFDFTGEYTKVKPNELMAYTMDDGRKAVVKFKKEGERTFVTVEFDAESENPEEVQKAGWQAILNSFKSYVENNNAK
jgi:uncharacterized protein YndB with AHSA1/START domain